MYDFLVGLNQEYDQVRIQILEKKKVLGLNEVMAIIHNEGSNRSLMVETPIAGSSTIIIEGTTTIVTNQRKGVSFPKLEKKNEGVWCTYCKSHVTLEKNVENCMENLKAKIGDTKVVLQR